MNLGSRYFDESVSSEESISDFETGGLGHLTSEHNFKALFEPSSLSKLEEGFALAVG